MGQGVRCLVPPRWRCRQSACTWRAFDNQPTDERTGETAQTGGCIIFQRFALRHPNQTMSEVSGQRGKTGFKTAPDIFLFPQRIPSLEDPKPPVHTLDTLRLPRLLVEFFGVSRTERAKHIWEVHVTIEKLSDGRLRRIVRVMYQGQRIDESRSRAWRP